MKTILVPTDFSDHALNALKVAASIARDINARIRVIHACNITTMSVKESAYYENYYLELKTRAEKELNKLMDLDFLKGIRVERFLFTDRLIWYLINNDKFHKAELVVVGSHGRSGFNRLLLGSNTEKIIRMAESPVLTIKNELNDYKIRKLVYVSDFNDESNAVYEKIKFLVRTYKPQIYLLKVITPSDFEFTPVSYRLMTSFQEKYALKKCSVNIYNHSNIEDGIIEFSQQVGADLVVIPTHGRTGFLHLINGSLAESIAVHEPKPVLSIKIPVVRKMAPVQLPTSELVYQNLEFF